jgi:hypothetical protein
MSSKPFWTSDMMSKNDVLMSILTFFHRQSCCVLADPSPHFRPVLYCCSRPPDCERSPTGLWSAVRCGASQHSDQILVQGCVECGGGKFSVGPALLLFLSVVCNVAAPFLAYFWNRSATPAKDRERWVYTSWKQGQKRTGPGRLMDFLNPGWIRVKHLS